MLGTREPDSTASLRHTVYALLITIAFGMMVGHIVGVERSGPSPIHGDNDRSRWLTIRSLVEQQSYAIGLRAYFDEAGTRFEDQGLHTEPGWSTIDKVLNPTPQWRNPNPQPGEPLYASYFYSSKPPLLSTVLAGEYWLLHKLFGWNLGDEGKWPIVRITLITITAIPWMVALVLLARLIELLSTSDTARMAAMTAVCFCTFVNPFANTLNNHTVAAWAVVFAIYPVLRACLKQEPLSSWSSAASGFGAAWTTTAELPAAAFAALLGLWILVEHRRAFPAYLAGVLPVAAAFLLTNYLAIGTITPAYDKFGTEWYNYAGSHWRPENIKGIDKPKDSTPVYLFHLTFGHHGWFSLTPFMLVALAGMVWPGYGDASVQRSRKILGWGTLALSLVILGFYLSKTASYNYGGWCCCARWLIWLTPLWILGSLPILELWMTKRWGRGWIYFTLAWSAMSVAYPMYSGWRHPWLFKLLEHLQLIEY
ncbi:MAG TPA: hypothetical protein PKA06_06720 [Gemmatales bacterium]|nr:hypothetical protein [Gemmatales bacterium]HMP16027.1 hypothetical protein [Gemmatales bacterium]